MRKLYFYVSVFIYFIFSFLFVKNILIELDLFYVMWGAILFPLPLVFTRYDIRLNKFVLIILLILGGLFLYNYIDTVYIQPGLPDPLVDPEPSVTLLEMILPIPFILLIITSYISVIQNYKEYNRNQYLLYGATVVLFIGCWVFFLKNNIIEHIVAVLLYVVITINYIIEIKSAHRRVFSKHNK